MTFLFSSLIILPKSLQKVFKPRLKLDIKPTQNEDTYIKFDDLTRFNWKVAVGKTTCTLEEFKILAEKSKGLVKIANEFVMLDEREVKSLIKQIDKLPAKLNRHELMKALLSGEVRDADVEIGSEFDSLIENIIKFEKAEIPEKLNAELRDYQQTGYSWLALSTG